MFFISFTIGGVKNEETPEEINLMDYFQVIRKRKCLNHFIIRYTSIGIIATIDW